MKNKFQYIASFLIVALLAGCRFRNDEYVDFSDIAAAKGLQFKVISQHETDLTDGLPTNCYLPDGTPVSEYHDESESTPTPARMPATTGTTAAGLLQSLFKYGNQNHVIEIVGTYPSIDHNFMPITLSGKVMLPRNGKPKRMILVSHYTVCSNDEAPSNCFSLEGVLVKLGYGLIIPDYLGYGVTVDHVHPYLVMDATAISVVDMYLAVKPWLDAVGKTPEQDGIILMGYSQGGATTMAVQRAIELSNNASSPEEDIKIHRVFAGGGPYDVKSTYERFVTTDTMGYPVAVPLVLQGMILGNNLSIKMDDLMQDRVYKNLDDWINSKRFTSAQINEFIGTKVTHEVLTPTAMDQTSEQVAELYKAMTLNSILTYNWEPEAPVYMMHSMDDETVSYINATNAKSKWRNANITYNFGHYGSHVQTCLRFIYSVQALLNEEEKEKNYYEN